MIHSAGAQATGHVVPSRSRSLVVDEVTVHNTGISLLLSTSVWVLLSPPIERRETRPTAQLTSLSTDDVAKEGRPKFNP